MTRIVWSLLIAIMVTMVGGCGTHNQLVLEPDGRVDQTTSPANVSRMDAEGGQVATNHGVGPSLVKQDAEGTWANMPGPLGVVSYIPATGQFYVVSPNDATFEGVEFTPAPVDGQPALKIAKMSVNLSTPLAQHAAAFATAAVTLQGMTQVEAAARVEQMKAAGEITSDVASLLLQFIVPLLAP